MLVGIYLKYVKKLNDPPQDNCFRHICEFRRSPPVTMIKEMSTRAAQRIRTECPGVGDENMAAEDDGAYAPDSLAGDDLYEVTR